MNSIEKENKPIDERTPLVETTFFTTLFVPLWRWEMDRAS